MLPRYAGTDIVRPVDVLDHHALGYRYDDDPVDEELVGKLLRVVRPGDVVTPDFRPDRATIRVDGQERIESVNIG